MTCTSHLVATWASVAASACINLGIGVVNFTLFDLHNSGWHWLMIIFIIIVKHATYNTQIKSDRLE